METTTSLWSTGRGIEGQLGVGTWVSNNTMQSVGCPTTTLSNNTALLDKTTISVYPNPTNNIVNINYNLEDSSTVILRLTNICLLYTSRCV